MANKEDPFADFVGDDEDEDETLAIAVEEGLSFEQAKELIYTGKAPIHRVVRSTIDELASLDLIDPERDEAEFAAVRP